MPRERILVIEGLISTALAHAAEIEKAGYEAVVVHSAGAALDAVAQNPAFGAVMLDLQLPDIHGLDWLRDNPEILDLYPIILTTADASLTTAIDAMRIGAFDYLVKPIAGARLSSALAVALRQGRSAPKKFPAKRGTSGSKERPGSFIGTSPQMQEVYRQIECVATSRATIFITGESGTGKEVCAEAIHGTSDRADGPFIALNCGAIPESLLESEIFGHLKGSFTGAVSDRLGAAQAAHKGTLFLDEICEMALPLQVKLLRFLQTGTVQRVGANRVEKVDVRIVWAISL
jgi:two-component system repressor protein LuxO